MSTPPLAVDAAGLVVMLDAAGRTIAQLEAENQRLRRLLESAAQASDPADVPPASP